MRILILGGNGFIGSAAVAKLLACGHEVTALARRCAGSVFARLYLLKRVVIGVLSLFWMTSSGLVALARFDAASGILAGSLPPFIAALLTVATSLLDIVLGAGVLAAPLVAHQPLRNDLGVAGLSRRFRRSDPELWIDPLGPLIKVLPSTFLALTALAVLEER